MVDLILVDKHTSVLGDEVAIEGCVSGSAANEKISELDCINTNLYSSPVCLNETLGLAYQCGIVNGRNEE